MRWLDDGTDRLSLRDLIVIVRQSPLSSALQRAIRKEAAEYMIGDYLLVGIFNTLRAMSWQLGQNKHAPKPEPFYAPGISNPQAPKALGDSMSIEEMDRRLEQYKPR